MSDARRAVSPPVLTTEELSVAFRGAHGMTEVVRSATLEVAASEVVGLVGESGSGKTVTSLATMGLIRGVGGKITGGRVHFDGRDVTDLPDAEWRRLRGAEISMIFQQPVRSLNPAYTVGDQVAESLRRHRGMSRKAAWDRVVELLDSVHIPHPGERAHDYPHQFSGGMCQRVMIAMALACEPKVLIADEPTTALDVTVQARILDLLREVVARTGVGILYITHDLGVVAEICNRVAVMYAGEVVESGAVDEVFFAPRHPYTEGLIAALPNSSTGRRFAAIPGQVPPPGHLPAGCRFHPRCQYAEEGRCTTAPLEIESFGDRRVRCVRHRELDLRGVVG